MKPQSLDRRGAAAILGPIAWVKMQVEKHSADSFPPNFYKGLLSGATLNESQ